MLCGVLTYLCHGLLLCWGLTYIYVMAFLVGQPSILLMKRGLVALLIRFHIRDTFIVVIMCFHLGDVSFLWYATHLV